MVSSASEADQAEAFDRVPADTMEAFAKDFHRPLKRGLNALMKDLRALLYYPAALSPATLARRSKPRTHRQKRLMSAGGGAQKAKRARISARPAAPQ
jgi:hypothetical protein